MPEKVVVIGGGVAGLTAAHELVERGYEVHLYERRQRLGGKSASITTDHGFPGEHGFRFFPGWYRHLPDTMRRIPYKHRTVADNLVAATESLFASYYRDPIPALLRFPRSLKDLATLAAFPEHMLRIGLTPGDFLFFFGKLAQFAACPEPLRLKQFETQTWWQFMDADQRSEQFRSYLVTGITRNTIAASPRQASAYTVATVALRTLMDTVRPDRPIDRVLNGPTNEVWIDPWVQYLRAKGVKFVLDAELESIEVRGTRVESVTFAQRVLEARTRRTLVDAMRVRIEQEAVHQKLELAEHVNTSENRAGLVRTRAELAVAWQEQVERLEALGLDPACVSADPDHYLNERRALHTCLCEAESSAVEADYFVFALPIEQMAYYVNRSEMLKRKDPALVNIVRLSNHVEWMAGIQFYLKSDVVLTEGHADCLDSEWALTAISQGQFWSEVDLSERGNDQYRGRVKSILSVDISAWNVPGRGCRKEAFSCTPPEIAREVWHQLKESLNRPNNTPLLRDEYLLDWPRTGQPPSGFLPEACYYLDQEIIDRFDRKKQAFYKVYESVRFSPESVAERSASGEGPTLFAHGDRLLMNAEPLFVNRANTLHLRPTPRTKIDNMFLAADYVRTNTNLATMEAANEAARLAVNEILALSGSRQVPCRIWSLAPPVDAVFGIMDFLTQPGHSAAAGGVRPSIASMATGFLQGTAQKAFDNFLTWRR